MRPNDIGEFTAGTKRDHWVLDTNETSEEISFSSLVTVPSCLTREVGQWLVYMSQTARLSQTSVYVFLMRHRGFPTKAP